MPANEQTPFLRKEKKELKAKHAPEVLLFDAPTSKKWTILTVIFVVQISMNYNASAYGFAVEGVAEEFKSSERKARLGQALFLIAYGFGCELFAPFSETFGRVKIMQLSMLLVNLFSLMGTFAPNLRVLLAARTLAGLSSAGGSVTIGMVADLYKPANQQYAVSFIVLASVLGAVIGGMAGAIMQNTNWRWNLASQLIFGIVSQALHLIFVPETCPDVLLDREAKRRREQEGQSNIYGPGEIEPLSFKEIVKVTCRPYKMLATEPIVLFLSLLSGFSDALIFIFIESFPLVYKQWGIQKAGIALAFVPLTIGYIIAFFLYFPSIRIQQKLRRDDPDKLAPESRLKWLLYLVPLEPLGLLIFAWTSAPFLVGSNYWIPMVSTVLIAVANYTAYLTSIDYTVAAYGKHAASATGGNGWMRDVLSGCCSLFAAQFYQSIGDKYSYQWGSTVLAGCSLLVAIPAYIFYRHGHTLRERSAYAAGQAEQEKKDAEED